MLQDKTYLNPELSIEERTENLLAQMNLMDKIGQMNQVWGLEQMKEFGGPDPEDMARKGLAGSMLYLLNKEKRNAIQKIAVEESPCGIPILYGSDVVHGYRTGFPIPLAMAASWDPKVLRESQRAAAEEARRDGIHWTFFPNADIARDTRWGRVGETMGEDPCLASKLVEAQIQGFHGESLNAQDSLMTCVKHFAGYGACMGGRDYDQVILSEAELRNVYFPTFEAGLKAGAETVMTAYMDSNNVPATINHFLLNEVLREEWGFNGFVVTDAGTIGSLITQGLTKDGEDAVLRSMDAHVDMDMGSFQYVQFLAKLVREGKIKEEQIDDAVRRILKTKFELGLFEHPYTDIESEEDEREHRKKALWSAEQSIVLLKNRESILPLSKDIKKLAVIGPIADAKDDTEGILGMSNVPQAVTVLEGIRNKIPDAEIIYRPGAWLKRDIPSMVSQILPDFCGKKEKEKQTDEEAELAIVEAVEAAKQVDTVVMVLGEAVNMSGEAASRTTLDLPGRQQELLEKVYETGKQIVLVLLGGRPLSLTWADEHIDAIVEAFQPGWEGGNAVANILFGDVNPSAKLPITVPRSAGQCPKFYAENLTHQPAEDQPKPYSRYWNEEGTPLYPFGYGLSYTTFEYSDLVLEKEKIQLGEEAVVRFNLSNTGSRAGAEIAQLYIHQRYGSDTRPKRLLKGFTKIDLMPGETRTIALKLTADDLRYYSSSKKAYVQDETVIDIWVGGNVNAELHTTLYVGKKENK